MFEHVDDEPDPHFHAPGAVGLLFLLAGIAQGAFLLIGVVLLAMEPQNDLMILAFAMVVRGLPPLVHLLIGAVLLLLANVGRRGPLPSSTPATLLAAGLWAALAGIFEACTCNILMAPLNLFAMAAAVAAAVFLTRRES